MAFVYRGSAAALGGLRFGDQILQVGDYDFEFIYFFIAWFCLCDEWHLWLIDVCRSTAKPLPGGLRTRRWTSSRRFAANLGFCRIFRWLIGLAFIFTFRLPSLCNACVLRTACSSQADPHRITVAVRDRPYERVITLVKNSMNHVGFLFRKGEITALVKDSSAARNGLLINHQLIEVNGQCVVGLKDEVGSRFFFNSSVLGGNSNGFRICCLYFLILYSQPF